MVTLSEIQEKAMDLPESERAILATCLLRSIPPCFDTDDDGGLAEALRRDAEMDADPSACMTYDEFKKAIAR